MKKFIRVYYEWGCDAKGKYAKINVDKDIKNIVKGYERYTGSDIKVRKCHGYPGTTLSKSNLEEPYNINKYRSFMGQLMWYTT